MSRVAYRVVQEALRNVVEHASATTAWVVVDPRGDVVVVSVGDDGRGLPPEVAVEGHVGLRLLGDHLEDLGGRLEIAPRPRWRHPPHGDHPPRPARPGLSPRFPQAAPGRVWAPRGSPCPFLGEGSVIRMLLADDHDAIHFGVGALVAAKPDLELVATATSGEAAVELAGTYAPDVVLVDLSMPGRGGLWALREIRRRRPRTWLVVLTGDGRARTSRTALAAGADRFVLKDRPVEDLLLAVREAGATPREAQGPSASL